MPGDSMSENVWSESCITGLQVVFSRGGGFRKGTSAWALGLEICGCLVGSCCRVRRMVAFSDARRRPEVSPCRQSM